MLISFVFFWFYLSLVYLSLNITWLLPCFFSLPLISMCFMTREEKNEIIRIVKKFPDLSHLAVKIRPTLLVVLSGFFSLDPKSGQNSSFSFLQKSAEALNHCTALINAVWWLDFSFLLVMPWISSSFYCLLSFSVL